MSFEAPSREHLSLYPTMNSIEDVIGLAISRLPILTKNEIVSILATYHNTLYKEVRAVIPTNKQ